MLRKLMKYDLSWVWKVWWFLIPSLFGLSFVSAFLLRFVIQQVRTSESTFMPLFVILAFLLLILSFVAILGSFTLTTVLVHVRFYKHLFTDEGYLTFTLPVSRAKILFSKFVNALFWHAMHLVLFVLCALIFFVISPPAEQGAFFSPTVFETIGMLLSEVWALFGGWTVLFAVEALLLLAAYGCFSTSMIFFCITFGATVVKKAKLLVAVGMYYAMNTVISFVGQISSIFGSIVLESAFEQIVEPMQRGMQGWTVALFLLLGTVMLATFASLLYFITQNTLERKLNLA